MSTSVVLSICFLPVATHMTFDHVASFVCIDLIARQHDEAATLQTLETMLKKRHQSIVIDMWVGSTTSA